MKRTTVSAKKARLRQADCVRREALVDGVQVSLHPAIHAELTQTAKRLKYRFEDLLTEAVACWLERDGLKHLLCAGRKAGMILAPVENISTMLQ